MIERFLQILFPPPPLPEDIPVDAEFEELE